MKRRLVEESVPGSSRSHPDAAAFDEDDDMFADVLPDRAIKRAPPPFPQADPSGLGESVDDDEGYLGMHTVAPLSFLPKAAVRQGRRVHPLACRPPEAQC